MIDDLSGRTFGRLTVIELVGRRHGSLLWHCRCDCGNECDVTGVRLRECARGTKSCGCLCIEAFRIRSTTHGVWSASPRTYRVWHAMMSRCNNPEHQAYADYGGRGITVCKRWHDPRMFLADMGPSRRGLTLDRIDNDKGYSPDNCRWATYSQQNANRRRYTHRPR